MSRQSDARALRRKAARTGVAIFERILIERDAVTAAKNDPAVKFRELVSYHIDVALEALELRGADLEKMVVVTIGEHPEHPGDLMIEAKAAHMRPEHEPVDDCPGCPIDHSADELDE